MCVRLRQVSTQQASAFAAELGCSHVETSSKLNYNVGNINTLRFSSSFHRFSVWPADTRLNDGVN